MNEIPNLPIRCEPGILGLGESLVVRPLPGSTVLTEYMDNTKDWRMNYEFAMQSRVQKKIHDTLWSLQSALDTLSDIESLDNSFEFQKLRITDTPYITRADGQGWSVFSLSIQVEITIFGE